MPSPGSSRHSLTTETVPRGSISEDLANLLVTQFPEALLATDPDPPSEVTSEEEDEQQLAALQSRTDIGDVERTQVVRARRGQVVFRTDVRMNESCCRLLSIPRIGNLDAIVEGLGKAQLEKGPGNVAPGEVGNVAIDGHRSTCARRSATWTPPRTPGHAGSAGSANSRKSARC